MDEDDDDVTVIVGYPASGGKTVTPGPIDDPPIILE